MLMKDYVYRTSLVDLPKSANIIIQWKYSD